MKKIRILALILALLMLPLGMLVSCKKNEVDPDNGEEEGDDGEGQKRPTSSTTIVDDGSKAGYLCYYTFDNAPQGAFSPAAPYALFQPFKEANFVIGRRDINGKKGGYLGIERPAVRTDAYFDLEVMSISNFSFTHVVSFDIYLGGGVINDVTQFVGRKGAGIFNNFLNFQPNGDVYAAGKYKIYSAAKSGEWVNFAVAINDMTRSFDVYINGAKVMMNIQYSTETYLSWEEQKIDKYRLNISGTNAYETELRIDNFGVSTGLTPQNATGEDSVIYTDVYEIKSELLTLNTLNASKQKVLDIYTANAALKSAVKSSPYAANKIAMSNALSLAKLAESGELAITTELQYDYGVENGSYKYGGNIGGKTFYSDPEVGKSFSFHSDIYKEGTDVGKLIVVNENDRQGVYMLDGDANFTKVTIIIDNVITYAVYADGVFKVVSDETFDPNDEQAIEFYEGAFHGKDYSYILDSEDTEGDFISVRFSPDQINGKIDFNMVVNDTVNIDAKNVPFNYDSGILTFEIDGTIYYLAYNMLSDEFTLYDPDGSYLLKPPVNEPITVGPSDILGIHYQNFQSGVSSLKLPIDNSIAKLNPWEKFSFELYIPEEMVDFSFGLYLNCGSGKYYYTPLKFTKAGFYTRSIALADFSSVGTPSIADLESVEFKMTGAEGGTNYAPKIDDNGSAANDGHGFYILGMSLIQEKIAEVEAPKSTITCRNGDCKAVTRIDGSKNPLKCPVCESSDIDFLPAVEYCTHKDQSGKTYLVDIEEMIPSSCTSIGYYARRCTNCYATVINNDKEFTEALGHDVEGQTVLTHYATCYEPGYTYQICKTCEERIQIAELPMLVHDYLEVLNNALGRMDYTCKHCGNSYSSFLNATLMSGKEKYDILPEGSYSLITYEKVNDNINLGDFEKNGTAVNVGASKIQVNPKYATFVSTRYGADYCFEYTKGNTETLSGDVHNPYLDVNAGGGLGAGEKFVFEVDIMPGDLGKDGKYAALTAQLVDRTDSKNVKWIGGFFAVNQDAQLTFGDATPIQLDKKAFTNIAIAVDPVANTKTLYVNGVFAARAAIQSTAIPTLKLYQVRILFDNGNNYFKTNTGASYYYNHIYVYKGAEPLCLVNTDIVEESKGSLGLYEGTATPAPDATPVTELVNPETDKKLFLKSYEKSSDYTFSFKLSAADALATSSQTLLKIGKVDGYNVAVEKDVLTVNGGYLYYMGVPIFKLEAGAEAEIKLICEDYLGRATVVVNGTEILTKRPYGTGDGFSSGEAYVRNYTFCAGAYTVSNISFVTTATVEAAE